MTLSRIYLMHYALPAFALAMLGLPLYVYLPTFYTQTFHLNALEVGIALFASRTLDLIIDPWIGAFSDRHAKRKQLMFIGAVLLLGGFYGVSFPLYPSALWLLVFSLIAYTGWSLITIPYFALSAELSPHYHVNTQLASSRELVSLLGFITALVVPYLFNISDNAQATIEMMFYLVLLTLPLLLLLFHRRIEEPTNTAHSISIPQGLRQLLAHVPQAKLLLLAFFTNSLANAIPATLFLFYVALVLQVPSYTGILLLVYFLSGVIALPAWIVLSKRIGKKSTWILSMILASAAFCFVPLLGANDLVFFFVITLISGLSLGADMALPASIQSDVSQQMQAQNMNVTGLLFGLWSVLTKFSLALAVGLSFGILGWFGFDSESPTTQSLHTLSLLYGLSPVIFKLLAISIIHRFNEQSPLV